MVEVGGRDAPFAPLADGAVLYVQAKNNVVGQLVIALRLRVRALGRSIVWRATLVAPATQEEVGRGGNPVIIDSACESGGLEMLPTPVCASGPALLTIEASDGAGRSVQATYNVVLDYSSIPGC
jgi:hypothetical protein